MALKVEYQLPPTWVDYFPSSAKMLISAGGLSLSLLMYYVGTKAFSLDKEHHH